MSVPPFLGVFTAGVEFPAGVLEPSDSSESSSSPQPVSASPARPRPVPAAPESIFRRPNRLAKRSLTVIIGDLPRPGCGNVPAFYRQAMERVNSANRPNTPTLGLSEGV